MTMDTLTVVRPSKSDEACRQNVWDCIRALPGHSVSGSRSCIAERIQQQLQMFGMPIYAGRVIYSALWHLVQTGRLALTRSSEDSMHDMYQTFTYRVK